MDKIVPFEKLSEIRAQHSNKKIVHCHGVFDLFHFGHLMHLKEARNLGDLLVLTLTPDRFVNKGPDRPQFNEKKRAALLASLDCVDFVCINEHPKAVQTIEALHPDLYVKGPDYQDKESDRTGGILEEEKAVVACGGRMVFTTGETESSTHLLNRYFPSWNPDQERVLQEIRQQFSLDEIISIIDGLSRRKVMVAGEPIIDTYVFCKTESVSSKSPTISASFLSSEDHAGGSLAIANHLSALGCDVSLLIAHGGEPYFQKLLDSSLRPEVRLYDHSFESSATVRKTRYVVPFRNQTIFELQNLTAVDLWKKTSSAKLVEDLEKAAKDCDVVLGADFGHGFFESSVLENFGTLSKFIALNVQTNSGNFGFNPFTKHRRYDYLSLDERECRLALHDRINPIEALAEKVALEHAKTPTSITLGVNGSRYYDRAGKLYASPIFFKDVVDTTGAGDAYFALSSVLVNASCPSVLIPFLGNCYAGLQSRTMGNKQPVSKVDLIRTVTAILK